MGQTADQLRQEIAGKRDDAAAKIDQIEAKVQDLPSLAKETVRGTVDQQINQVRESVDAQLNQARETVVQKVGEMKQQTDFRGQIDQRPLAALGVAFAGGYLLSKLIGGDKSSHGGGGHYQSDWSQAHSASGGSASPGSAYEASRMGISGQGSASHAGGQAPSQPNAVVSALKQAAHEAGLDNTLSALSGALVATLTDQFYRTIRETFPDFAQHLEQQGGLGGSQAGGGSRSDSGMGAAFGSSSGGGGSAAMGSSGSAGARSTMGTGMGTGTGVSGSGGATASGIGASGGAGSSYGQSGAAAGNQSSSSA